MTTGAKLAQKRKENNYTQEQLAQLLGVSRQAVSKWESDVSFPETDKLLRLSQLYGCTIDYLLKDDAQEEAAVAAAASGARLGGFNYAALGHVYYEKKSERTLWGLPLWHINIGPGRVARGVFAVGLIARGYVAVGLLAMGYVSVGLMSLGLLSLGVLAAGLVALGSIAAGLLACGAVALGLVSLGAASVGGFAFGAAAYGKYLALGDEARALIALGNSRAAGSVYEKIGPRSAQDIETAAELLRQVTPAWLSFARRLAESLLRALV